MSKKVQVQKHKAWKEMSLIRKWNADSLIICWPFIRIPTPYQILKACNYLSLKKKHLIFQERTLNKKQHIIHLILIT